MSDPQNLRDLGQRLDEAQGRLSPRKKQEPPSSSGIALRLVTELFAAIAFGGGLGWGIDWSFGHFGVHTKPVFFIVMFMLGAAAGLRNVIRAANEINAEVAASAARSAKDGKEN